MRRLDDWAARVRLEYLFVAMALAFGVAQAFIVPPLQVPDEGDHWFRAWALTDGQLTTDADGAVTLPGNFADMVTLYTRLVSDTQPLPPSLDGQPGFVGYEELFNEPGSATPVRVISRTATYGPMGYLPQAAGIGFGRLLGASPFACFYLARMANLFAAIALLFLAIRLAPFGKQLFLLLALLPMTMFQLASVSCDALTIAGAMLFISIALWATTRPALTAVNVALLVATAAILLNIKPGYEPLALLALLVSPSQLGGRARYVAFVVATALAVLGVFVIQYLATGGLTRMEADASASDQLLIVLRRPVEFLGILWSSVGSDLLRWTIESIGVLGWYSVALPPALYLFVLIVGVAFFVGMAEPVALARWQRLVLAVAGVASFVAIALALFVFLPTRGEGLSFQGRYLAPIWLTLLLSAYGVWFTRRRLGALPMIASLVVIMVVNLQTLYTFYYA